jgi:hypothetical protein
MVKKKSSEYFFTQQNNGAIDISAILLLRKEIALISLNNLISFSKLFNNWSNPNNPVVILRFAIFMFLSQGEFKPSSSDSADRERSIIRVIIGDDQREIESYFETSKT